MAFDADGFLWIVTSEGLSRFDGERFATFGPADGLLGRAVNDIAFGPDGSVWVATQAGLFLFRPREISPQQRLFRRIPIEGMAEGDMPYRLLAARSGALWVGTMERLWRVTPTAAGTAVSRLELCPDRAEPFRSRVQSLSEDPGGAIWVGSHSDGFFRIRPDGRIDHCPVGTKGAWFVRDFYFPGDGSVWTAYFGGVAIFDRAPFPQPATPARLYGNPEGMEIDTSCLLPMGEGLVLVGTTAGIIEMRRSTAGGWRVGATQDRRSGLPGDLVRSLARDAEGSLWVGLGGRGLVKLLQNGFSTFDDIEKPGSIIIDLSTDRAGHLVVLSARGAMSLTATLPDGEAAAHRLSLPSSLRYVGWGGGQKFLTDSRGSWWIATGSGVLRYDDPHGIGPRRLEAPPDAFIGPAEGLPGQDVLVLAEDSRGDVWISTEPLADGASAISRWSRATGRIENFPASATGSRTVALRFLETRDGGLWILLMDGRLLRRRDGRFEAITWRPDRDTELHDLFEDSRGRLWLLGREAYVSERPAEAEPRFERREMPPGADGAQLNCAVEDGDGRLFFGTNHGIVRLDPDTSETRRFTADDGLVGNSVTLCEQDGSGALWFSDFTGLSRFEARGDPARAPARARLGAIRVDGETIPLPSNGATSAGLLTIPPGRHRLGVEFFSIHHGPGPSPRFQYRLEGSDPDWSRPASERSVQYASLAPGRYRFQVRTVSEDGTPSDAPAFIPLEVLAPLWQRSWFLALLLLATAGAVYAGHRLRIARMLAVERIRTRIATDLHDDVGSSLSQISILSQLARRQAGGAGGTTLETLERITDLSGEIIDSMSDVVWAISPRWDTVSALVHRMRRFASELFADSAVELEMSFPEDEKPIETNLRSQLYLIFKEALHN